MVKYVLAFALGSACLWSPAGDITGSVTVVNARGRPMKIDKGEVVVYIAGLTRQFSRETVKGGYTMDTLNKQYDPQLMVVPRGATVTFNNFDPILHNVFSVSGKNRFDAGLFRENEVARHTFQHTGLVRIFCNVHHSMNALIYIADNPYYATIDDKGRFTIKGVPPGNYTIEVLHRVAGNAAFPVEVEEGETRVDLELKAKRKRLRRHKDKDGKPYRRRGDKRY